jgi:hypothetical protein
LISLFNTWHWQKNKEWSVKEGGWGGGGRKNGNKRPDAVLNLKWWRLHRLFFCFQPNIAFLQHTVLLTRLFLSLSLSLATCWFKGFFCFFGGGRGITATMVQRFYWWKDGWGRGKQGTKIYIYIPQRTADWASAARGVDGIS